MSNVCPECDGERVVVEGTGQQADFAPCPKCAVGVEGKRVFSPEAHGVLDYNTLPKAEACSECGEAQGYHKLGCTKCVHTNKNGLFGLECIGCGLLLDGPQYGKKIEVPDVVVEQGPNTNGDIFPRVTEEMLPPVYNTHAAKKLQEDLMSIRPHKVPFDPPGGPPGGVAHPDDEALFKEPVVRGALKQLLEQDVYKRTAEEVQQRMRDLTDLSFRPSYVQSTPDLKNVFRPKEAIGEAVINAHAIRRLRGGVGWDANGSPTEEWP